MFWAPMDLKLALASHVSLGEKCLNGVGKAQFIHHAPQGQEYRAVTRTEAMVGCLVWGRIGEAESVQ